MTAPQFPAGWAPPAPPQQPQYAPQAPPQYAPPGYAPQPVQQFQQAPPQYAPQPQYQQPVQQYGPPMQQPAPAIPLARPESLDDYLNQPASGANWWAFKNIGESRMGMVKRDIGQSDVVQKTFKGVPQTRRDGAPEWNLVIPLIQQDGTEWQWEVSGKAKTELSDKVKAAGGPANGIPEKGSLLRVTFSHKQENQNGSASKILIVDYARPTEGAAPPAPQQPAPVAQPQQQYAPQPVAPQQFAAPQQFQQPAPVAAPQQPVAQAPAPQAVQLDPAAQAQYQALLGGAAPQ